MKNKLLLIITCVTLLFSFSGCGKTEQAKAVENSIAEIGEVSYESKSAIIEAEKAYAGLSDEEKKTIENYSVLEVAREEFDSLEPIIGSWVFDSIKMGNGTYNADSVGMEPEELATLEVTDTSYKMNLIDESHSGLWERVEGEIYEDLDAYCYYLGDEDYFAAVPHNNKDYVLVKGGDVIVTFKRVE